ncbi:uridine kinase [Acanthamoeba castellanii str. Neff]|uniref:Uridine kinase n=1 Tax=Acanthamoeba castellanii (strain ATCC 30010 / Neff) TaxID=1257118 RepID=L8GPP5_ACACF|nr:uridine kinase [Acanthamoeba castellanii str. Neff]ELR15134.1 uridine kinase [Acanthamoeba castellanii str. Neff]
MASSSSSSSTTSTAALRAQVRPHPTLPGEVEFVSKDALLSFDQGFFVAVKGIQLLRQHNRRTTIVSIAGPSGAGKTSIAKKIAEVIPKSLVVSLDNYLDGSRVVEENYDDYRLVDFELLGTPLIRPHARTGWTVELGSGTDSEGWEYSFTWGDMFAWQPKSSKKTLVRRRKWVKTTAVEDVTTAMTQLSTVAGMSLRSHTKPSA